MSKHTPGHWSAAWNEDGSWVGVDCGDGTDAHKAEVCTICVENIELSDEEYLERAKADARLIAAAPDLLEACEAALEKFNEMYASRTGRKPEAVEKVIAAIAKAKGES